MEVIDTIQDALHESLDESKYFVFKGEFMRAFAFLQGLKNDEVKELKKLAKEDGFEYDYKYDCYFKKINGAHDMTKGYRLEKNEFIEDLIKWKFQKS